VKREAFAKVNFTLEVFAGRDDGYHDLRSVVVPVSLSDTVSAELSGSITSDSGFADDLCVKAAEVLRRETSCGLGAAIKIEKRIPVGGGLGGGSADAAASLHLLNELWGLHLPVRELVRIGAQVGSDVPSLVLGGAAVMEGRGEKVRRLALPTDCSYHLVLANPRVFCSTAEVYANCTERLHKDAPIVYNMSCAMESGDLHKVAGALCNDLQEAAVKLHPEIAATVGSMRRLGVEGVLLCGSGSTVFGLVPDESEGREISARLEAEGYWSCCVHTIVR
jgi:4-diphosphocytidyl-2-C-methyl-D-erythritol kinase